MKFVKYVEGGQTATATEVVYKQCLKIARIFKDQRFAIVNGLGGRGATVT